MAQEQVTTAISGDPREPITVDFDFGSDLQDAIDKFGEDVVFSRWTAACRVDLQGYIRSLMRKTEEDSDEFALSNEEIVEKAQEWKPGLRKPGKSKKEKITEQLASMSEEEKQEILAMLEG